MQSATTFALLPGSHRVQNRTPDGRFASLTVAVNDATQTIDIALLPVESISGRVVLENSDRAGPKVGLEHIVVELEPGDVLAETTPGGAFAFPPSPIAPNARLAIVAVSLPPG